MTNPDLKAMPWLKGSSDAAVVDTSYAHKRIPTIPPEIYRIIVGNLRRRDIKHARLTCKELYGGLTPFLFDTIHITNENVDVEHTRRILQHFRPYITTIAISPMEHYTIMSKSTYQSLVRRCFSYCYQEQAQWRQLLDLGYETYCEELPDKSSILSDRELQELLKECLATVPNTRKVVLSDQHRLQRLVDTLLRKYWTVDYEACDDMRCVFGIFHSMLDKYSCGKGAGSWTTTVNTLLTSLPEAISDLRELAIMSSFNRRFIEPSSLDLLIQADCCHTNLLANMTKLRFSFARNSNARDDILKNGMVAKALRRAHNLQCLLLDFEWEHTCYQQSPVTTFQAVLDGCRFPKLKAFGFANGDATEKELVSFFVKHTKIRILILSDVTLRAGFWKDVAQTIKETNNLQVVRLLDLLNGFENFEESIELWWQDYYGDVDAFFHHNGPNPFSREQIERWERDNETKRAHRVRYEWQLYGVVAFDEILGLDDYLPYDWQL